MKIHVLGSAAGGGFPQWNCNCSNCAGLRAGSLVAKARTQSSIALSSNGVSWLLCNASPDLTGQIRALPALQPGRSVRDIVQTLTTSPDFLSRDVTEAAP